MLESDDFMIVSWVSSKFFGYKKRNMKGNFQVTLTPHFETDI